VDINGEEKENNQEAEKRRLDLDSFIDVNEYK
jgi:hypothetical protein